MNNNELKNKLSENAGLLKMKVEIPLKIEKITEEAEKRRRKIKAWHILGKISCGAAGVAAAFVLTFNAIPNLAYAVSDIPVLSDAVKIVTLGRFEQNKNGNEAKVVTPKLEGLINKELEKKLNNEFKENSDAVIKAFQNDIKELEEEFGEGEFHIGVDADYVVRTDNENILAIDCYILNIAGSSSTKHSFYNIDKKTGELLTLQSLFKKESDYITPISKYIKKEMQKQNESGEGYYWIDENEPGDFEGFSKIKADQNFFINESGNIVICFDKYEVATGAGGCPEFEIPNNILKDILK